MPTELYNSVLCKHSADRITWGDYAASPSYATKFPTFLREHLGLAATMAAEALPRIQRAARGVFQAVGVATVAVGLTGLVVVRRARSVSRDFLSHRPTSTTSIQNCIQVAFMTCMWIEAVHGTHYWDKLLHAFLIVHFESQVMIEAKSEDHNENRRWHLKKICTLRQNFKWDFRAGLQPALSGTRRVKSY